MRPLKAQDTHRVTHVHGADARIVCMAYSARLECVVSCDSLGGVEFWSLAPPDFARPKALRFEYTDLVLSKQRRSARR